MFAMEEDHGYDAEFVPEVSEFLKMCSMSHGITQPHTNHELWTSFLSSLF